MSSNNQTSSKSKMCNEEGRESTPRKKGNTNEEIMNDDNDEQPFKITYVEECLNRDMLRHFKGEHTRFLQVGEKKWCFPSNAEHLLKDFHNMEVRPTDVWIVTFPRSGTTLMLELVWLLTNNLNFEEALRTPLDHRAPFLELHSLIHPKQVQLFLEENAHSEDNCKAIKNITTGMFDYLKQMKGRRVIKTHLSLSILPKNLLTAGCKVVYVARNPKDVAISFFHHNRLFRMSGYAGDFPTYWKYFTRNLVLYSPYWEHVLEAWNNRHEKNIIFLFYEDLIKNLGNNIHELQKFFGTNYSDEELRSLENHLKFDNFQKNKSVNCNILTELGLLKKGEESFVRKGKTGITNAYFNEQELEDANKWVEENLKGTDLRFSKE